MISIMVHESYRKVVAVCDEDLIGKKFEEGKRQLDIRERFYKGDMFTFEEAVKRLERLRMEDATFNIVGPESIRAVIQAQILAPGTIPTVQSIPFALVLV